MAFPITVVRGDTFNYKRVKWVVKFDGVIQPLTGYSAVLVVTAKSGQELLRVSTAGSSGNRLQILVPSNGEITPDVSAANMRLLVGTHEYDLEITSPAGEVFTIVNRDPFTVNKDRV